MQVGGGGTASGLIAAARSNLGGWGLACLRVWFLVAGMARRASRHSSTTLQGCGMNVLSGRLGSSARRCAPAMISAGSVDLLSLVNTLCARDLPTLRGTHSRSVQTCAHFAHVHLRTLNMRALRDRGEHMFFIRLGLDRIGVEN